MIEIGSPPTDLTGDVAPEIARVFQLAILVAEKLDVLDAEHVSGPSLLLFSNRCQLLRRDAAITRSLVAVGHDHVGDLPAFLGQPGDGATSQEIRIVRMRGDEHHPPVRGRHESCPSAGDPRRHGAGLTTALPCRLPASSAAPNRNGAERSTASARAPITRGPTIWPLSVIVRIQPIATPWSGARHLIARQRRWNGSDEACGCPDGEAADAEDDRLREP